MVNSHFYLISKYIHSIKSFFLCRYNKKSECLKKSYNNNHRRQILYRGQPVSVSVDGSFTFDENLCDVESLDIIANNMFRNIEKQDELPGVNFTKKQTFFINIAQVKIIIRWDKFCFYNKSVEAGLLWSYWRSQSSSVKSS